MKVKKHTSDNPSPFITGINSNYRKVYISVAVEGITDPFTEADIKYFKIDSKDIPGRTFGVSYCHQFKITFKNSITVSKGNSIKVSFTCNNVQVSYPTFYVDEVQRNKVTGETTVIGYDLMAKANDIKYTAVGGTIDAIANDVASQLGTTVLWLGNTACKPSKTWTVDEINTDGSMSLRSVIKAIAEITGTIAYINCNDKLVFRGLTTVEYPPEGTQNPIPDYFNYEYVMDNSLFYEEEDITTQTITGIAHRNELNDTTYATGSVAGPNCIVLFNNPFLSKLNETNKKTILTNVFTYINKDCISYNLTHLGNPALELGDPIKINDTTYYYLQETLEYNGGLKATGGWEYAEQDSTDLPPTSVTQDNIITRATVDKVNNRIELVTGEVNNQAYIKIEAINNNPTTATISANKINLEGVTTFVKPGDIGPNGSTEIYGGRIKSGQIQSVGYNPPAQYEDYSNGGSEIDLTNGNITTPMFFSKWDEDEQKYRAGFKGELSASQITSGTLNSERINTNTLYVQNLGAASGDVSVNVNGNLKMNNNIALDFDTSGASNGRITGDTGDLDLYVGLATNIHIGYNPNQISLNATNTSISGNLILSGSYGRSNPPTNPTPVNGQIYFKLGTVGSGGCELFIYENGYWYGTGLH